MNDEQKRLEEIREGGRKPVSINYSDLILLLQHDDKLQNLLKDIFQPAISAGDQELRPKDSNTGSQVQSITREAPVPSEAGMMYEELLPTLQLLKLVRRDTELQELWLRPDESVAKCLLRLVATAAQWDQLLELWDLLAGRCKAKNRKASREERQLLESCLEFYNLTLRSRQAQLIIPKSTIAFDHTQHARATPQGETVVSVLLPGLTNAAGVVQKKPLVATE